MGRKPSLFLPGDFTQIFSFKLWLKVKSFGMGPHAQQSPSHDYTGPGWLKADNFRGLPRCFLTDLRHKFIWGALLNTGHFRFQWQ